MQERHRRQEVVIPHPYLEFANPRYVATVWSVRIKNIEQAVRRKVRMKLKVKQATFIESPVKITPLLQKRIVFGNRWVKIEVKKSNASDES